MTSGVDRATRIAAPERRSLQDALAWPIALMLLAGGTAVFLLPRFVPSRFLAIAVGATLAAVTVALVALLTIVVEQWLRREVEIQSRSASEHVEAVGVDALGATVPATAMMPLAAAYADAGARAARRSAAREHDQMLARIGTDAADFTDRAIAAANEALHTAPANASVTAARVALSAVADCTTALRRVTAPIPAGTTPVDLVDEIRSLAAMPGSDGSRTRVTATLDTEGAPVVIDRDLIRTQLYELLDLARQASPDAAEVTIHVSRVFRASLEETPVRRNGDSRLTIVPRASGDAVRAWVRRVRPGPEILSIVIGDAGAAPTSDEAQRALDPFAVPRRGDRFGIALAMLRRTVIDANGTMWLDGAREGGMAVHLLLPLAGA